VTKEDLTAMELDIKKAKKDAEFVIVSCHWGMSQGGTYSVAPHQSGIGRAAIKAGAELVLGHHQHAYQGVELYRGKINCHGLGNFIFDTIDTPFFPETVLFHCTFQKHGIKEACLQPVMQDSDAHPHPLPPENENSRRILSHLKELSKELGTGIKIEGGHCLGEVQKVSSQGIWVWGHAKFNLLTTKNGGIYDELANQEENDLSETFSWFSSGFIFRHLPLQTQPALGSGKRIPKSTH
jgi:poly-gamma-glutamate capsule biosynthesis protein CapA/YwtB (metallophosphatase superfamily)